MYLHRGEVRQLAPLHLYGLTRRWRSVFESFLRLGGALRLRLLTAQDDLVAPRFEARALQTSFGNKHLHLCAANTQK